MGCPLCKLIKQDYYEQEAGNCTVCMSINVALAALIIVPLTYFLLPVEIGVGLFVAALYRIKRVGYLFPDTPKYLPYFDFILEPLGTVPEDGEMLSMLAEDVAEACRDAHEDDEDVEQCIDDLTDVVLLCHSGELTNEQCMVNISDILDKDPEEAAAALSKGSTLPQDESDD